MTMGAIDDSGFWGKPYDPLPDRPMRLEEIHERFSDTYDVYVAHPPDSTEDSIVRTEDDETRSEFMLRSDDSILRIAYRCPEDVHGDDVAGACAEWRYLDFFEMDAVDTSELTDAARERLWLRIMRYPTYPYVKL